MVDRQCLRTDKLRTESRIEPRSRGLDKSEERQCVSGAVHQGRTIDDIHDSEADICVINSPREAAIAIVHLINSRNQNVALLALAVRTFYLFPEPAVGSYQ